MSGSPQDLDAIAHTVSRLAAAWRVVEAEELALRALASNARHAPLAYAHAFTLLKQGRAGECVDALRRAVTRHPDEANLQVLLAFALNYDARASANEVAAAHLRVGLLMRRVAGRALAASAFPRRREGAPPRIGLVSADLYRHSITYFLDPLLAALPRGAAEIVVLNTSRTRDEVTDRLRAMVGEWHDLAQLDHDAFARAARDLRLDVAIDLSGLTSGHRQKSFAMRLAPLQWSYLGYPHASGIDTFDARIADAITDPPETPNRMGEKIVRLTGCFLCYRPPGDAPDVAERRADPREVVFGCFGNLSKINEPLVRAWAGILNSTPGSRLVLKNHALADERLRAALPERLRAWGLDPARVDLRAPAANERDHLAAYNEIDIALDTFPYVGTTTTCEALLMGVPVVSRIGDRHASRVGASLLDAAGIRTHIAATDQELVERVSEAVRQTTSGERSRKQARALFLGSRLTDRAAASEIARVLVDSASDSGPLPVA